MMLSREYIDQRNCALDSMLFLNSHIFIKGRSLKESFQHSIHLYSLTENYCTIRQTEVECEIS